MNTVRLANVFSRDRLGAVSALLGLALLAACESPRVAQAAEDADMVPVQKIDGICTKELSYDVTGPYFQSCRNYLRRHVQAQPVAVHLDEPAEHRACEQIGLPKGTDDWRRCVQELYQLDISADHL
jgi:hypothetical protein